MSTSKIPPKDCRVLRPEVEAPGPGSYVAIDTEFVTLQLEELDINANGEREIVRPTRLGLARVSVLRGNGVDEGVPFINDYITISEPIVDYLTRYSGVQEGDLDPRSSGYNLVPLKVAYKKLWLLLNLGVVFIGHGLPKDFRIINIHVPKAQVLDTVDLFFILRRQRKLSLRFLAWYLLKEDIQQDNHDSIEDARTAFRLWRKYEEFRDAGIVETMLEEVYNEGKKWGYKPPGEVVVSRAGGAVTGGGPGKKGLTTVRGPIESGLGVPITISMSSTPSMSTSSLPLPSTLGDGSETPEILAQGEPSGPGTPVGRKGSGKGGGNEYFERPLR